MMFGLNDVIEIKDVFMNGIVLMVMYFMYIFLFVYEEGDLKNIGFVILEEKEKVVYGIVFGLIILVGFDDE